MLFRSDLLDRVVVLSGVSKQLHAIQVFLPLFFGILEDHVLEGIRLSIHSQITRSELANLIQALNLLLILVLIINRFVVIYDR